MSFVTPDLCDENPGSISVLEPLFTNYGGKRAFSGEIVTVKCHEDNTVVKEQSAQPGQGKVMVVDGGGSMRCALLGDLIAAKLAENGWEGIIIYGCIRDVDAIGEIDLGVQALRTVPIKSNRQGRGDLNVPIKFASVDLQPGHYVYADNNGIIVSPQALNISS